MLIAHELTFGFFNKNINFEFLIRFKNQLISSL